MDCCYILRSGREKFINHTYNGYTNNLKRRIRQHNGIIKGGAKSTHNKGPWNYYCIITGFENRQEALQMEWKLRTITGKRRPSKYNKPIGRIKGLNCILQNKFFTSNSKRPICDMGLTIYLHPDFHMYLTNVPDNITLLQLSDLISDKPVVDATPVDESMNGAITINENPAQQVDSKGWDNPYKTYLN